MKTDKKFDSVKMMREIRDKVSSDIKDMSPEQILDYISKGRKEYEELITRDQQQTDVHKRVINA
jgi:hypothetical protein